MNPKGETETALNKNRLAQFDPLEARAQDRQIVTDFVRTRNAQTDRQKDEPEQPAPRAAKKAGSRDRRAKRR